MLPDALIQTVAGRLGIRPQTITPTFGGYSHYTGIVTLGSLRVVIKAAELAQQRNDLRREAMLLTALATTRLPIPALIALVDDSDWTAEVFSLIPGENGMRSYTLPVDTLAPICASLGRTLAQVHATPTDRVQHLRDGVGLASIWLHERAAAARESLPQLKLNPALAERLDAALAHPLWSTPGTQLVHGDPGLHNALWDGWLRGLVDWEWAGIGHPDIDLAWVSWTLRWRQTHARCRAAFFEGYARSGALDDLAGLQAALGQIAIILCRTYDRADSYAEWLRRADWTTRLQSLL